MRSILSRSRSKSRPKIPHTLLSLGEILENKSLYKETLISENNKTAVIFTSDKLLQGINDANEIFMDGTFSVSRFF